MERREVSPAAQGKDNPLSSNRPIRVGDKVRLVTALKAEHKKLEWTVEAIDPRGIAKLYALNENENMERAYQYLHLLRPAAPTTPPAPVQNEEAVGGVRVLPEDTPDMAAKTALYAVNTEWHNGVSFTLGERMRHISRVEVEILGFAYYAEQKVALVRVLHPEGEYRSRCLLSELMRDRTVLLPRTAPETEAPKDAVTITNYSNSLLADAETAAILNNLQGLAHELQLHHVQAAFQRINTSEAILRRTVDEAGLDAYVGTLNAEWNTIEPFLNHLVQAVTKHFALLINEAERE
jgi:hypothetical protein